VKAFLLGAGLGTRLRPLTSFLPKPLVPLGHHPLIYYAWQACQAVGCRDFAINTHHLAGCWQSPAAGWGELDWQTTSECGKNGEPVRLAQRGSCSLRLFHEPTLLETGGALRNVRDWVGDDDVLVHNGDVYATLPLEDLLRAHRASGRAVTLALLSDAEARHIAIEEDRVIDIRQMRGKAPGTHGFTGIYCMNQQLIEALPDEEICSVIPAFLRLAEQGQVGAVVMDQGAWFDLGTRESYLEVNRHFAIDQAIHPSAQVDASAKIEGSIIGAGAVIGEGAVIRDSVIWPGGQVLAGSRLHRCIVCSSQPIAGHHVDCDL
jgi:NDP-sugar pyrophosphorylase family protein